jgi:photosystem II stability/assembly factor-like uncharacterized protein
MCFSRSLVAALVCLALPALARAQDWATMGQFARSINCIYFLPTQGDPVVGFVATGDFETGHGEIYRTDDSGRSWTKTYLPSQADESVTDILFKDPDLGWATTLTARNDQGRIYRTTDGGRTWEATSAMSGVYLGLGYSPASHLLFTARGGAPALESSDDGQTWRVALDATITSFGFVDDSIGFATGSHRFTASGASFATTRDGGRTWKYSTLNRECYQPLLIPGSHELFAIDDQSGALYTSRDLGETWDTVYRFSAPHEWMSGCIRGNKCGRLYAQSGYSQNIGLVVSEDKGRSWRDLRPSSLTTPLTNTIDTRFFMQGDVVYAAHRAEVADASHTLYRYRRSTAGPASGSPFANERSLVIASPGCEYADTNITIAYPNDCAAATLVEASLEDNVHFQLLGESLPKRLSNVTSVRLAYIPTDGDTVRSFLALTYEIGDAVIHDTIRLIGCLTDGNTLTRLRLTESTPAKTLVAGDTVTLRLELRDAIPASLRLDSVECTVSYDGDLLSVLQPIASQSWKIASSRRTASGVTMSITAPHSDLPAGSSAASITLRVMLSLDTIANVRLTNIRWYGREYTGCQQQYASSLLSLPVTREATCTDPTLLAFMREAATTTLEVAVGESAIDATIVAPSTTTAQASIVNTLGERVSLSRFSLTAGRNSLLFAKPMMPGVYYFVLEAGRTRLTRRMIID